MPNYLIPRKSGVHRTACFALYRALLQQDKKLPLNKEQRPAFGSLIKTIFRRNSKLHSIEEISLALRLGHETLEALHDGQKQHHILARIFLLNSRNPVGSGCKIIEPLANTTSSKCLKAPKISKPLESPYPNASRVLDRPYATLSGRRHVPKLVNANRVPILRFKKPQSPYLSRIIRDTIKTRQSRILRAEKLADQIRVAKDEEEWDNILFQHHGLDHKFSEECWSREPQRAFTRLEQVQAAATQRRVEISAWMHAIVEKEKVLAEEERLRLQDEKHRERMMRRFARKGLEMSAIEERMIPKREPPALHRAKFKTREEIGVLQAEYSKNRTDEDRAQIVEARAKRKEEKAKAKELKKKRKEEHARFWEEKLRGQVKHSTQNEKIPPNTGRSISDNGRLQARNKPSAMENRGQAIRGTSSLQQRPMIRPPIVHTSTPREQPRTP